MKGLLFPGNGELKIVELPDPQPGPGEVVIAMRRSGICGTDLHYLHETTVQRGERAAVVPGHETAGDIIAVGPCVTRRKVGERVIGFHHIGCGFCRYCRQGVPTQCATKRVVGRHIHGSDGQYVVLPEWAAFPLPDDFDYGEGVLLACNVSTAYSALMKAGVSALTQVAIFGQGVVGQSVTMLASALGARVASVDLSDGRLERSRELGSELGLNPQNDDVISALKRWGGGRGVDVVIECSGSSLAVGQALGVLGPRAIMVLVGAGGSIPETPLGTMLAGEATIIGSSVYQPGEYEPMIDLIRTKQLSLKRLIEREYRLEEALEAFAAAERRDSGKLLFRWD